MARPKQITAQVQPRRVWAVCTCLVLGVGACFGPDLEPPGRERAASVPGGVPSVGQVAGSAGRGAAAPTTNAVAGSGALAETPTRPVTSSGGTTGTLTPVITAGSAATTPPTSPSTPSSAAGAGAGPTPGVDGTEDAGVADAGSDASAAWF